MVLELLCCPGPKNYSAVVGHGILRVHIWDMSPEVPFVRVDLALVEALEEEVESLDSKNVSNMEYELVKGK